jgi:hypothetical protein
MDTSSKTLKSVSAGLAITEIYRILFVIYVMSLAGVAELHLINATHAYQALIEH